MARLVSELTQGQSFSRSVRDGQIADRATRTFKILLDLPTEVPQIQSLCGVFVGDPHPDSPDLYCLSFSAQYDGDSRMVVLANFEYEPIISSADEGGPGGGGGQGGQSPDVRPANWSLSSSLVEVPVRMWRKRTGELEWGDSEAAANPVGDIYDGITAMRAMVTISITQFNLLDPTQHAEYVGCINEEQIVLGTLVMPPHTVMLRGLNVQSQVKPWGAGVFRGWESQYEFAYNANKQQVFLGSNDLLSTTIDLGWDIAVPVSGWNCKAFDPTNPTAFQDRLALPLKKTSTGVIDSNPYALVDGAQVGRKYRAMVEMPTFTNNRSILLQSPSASPIALNGDGTPRLIDDSSKPLVLAYQVHEAINFTQALGLRLY
jgi:hypothetical protein